MDKWTKWCTAAKMAITSLRFCSKQIRRRLRLHRPLRDKESLRFCSHWYKAFITTDFIPFPKFSTTEFIPFSQFSTTDFIPFSQLPVSDFIPVHLKKPLIEPPDVRRNQNARQLQREAFIKPFILTPLNNCESV